MPDSLPATIPPVWSGLVDDAAIFPPGNAPLHEATAAHGEHRTAWYGDLLGSFVLKDTDLPLVRGVPPPALGRRHRRRRARWPGRSVPRPASGCDVAGLEIALRDLDDLAGNARRVVAAVDHARGEGVLADDVPVFVELPAGRALDPSYGWEAAADEVAAAELRLKLRTGGVEAHLFPTPASSPPGSTPRWTGRCRSSAPRGCTTPCGTRRPERLRAARLPQRPAGHRARPFDGASRADDRRDPRGARRRPAGGRALEDVARARRWFTSLRLLLDRRAARRPPRPRPHPPRLQEQSR